MHSKRRVFPELQGGAAREAIRVRTKMPEQEGLDTSNPLFARPRHG
jgi:hypothetical protein